MRYAFVCVAGTFDGLHAGHEALLLRAFADGERVFIGMTSDAFVRTYKRGAIRTYTDRYHDLTEWIKIHGYTSRTEIVTIDDPFEPAESDASLEALVVSEESLKNGEELNRRRLLRGLSLLDLIVVPLVPADDMRPISATRVRAGEIDRVGRLVMPEILRNDLALPMGRVLMNDGIQEVLKGYIGENKKRLITVGDMTTKTFLDQGVTPNLMVVDNKINRSEFMELRPVFLSRRFRMIRVKSGPGYISRSAMDAVHEIFTASGDIPVVLEIVGEEDLLALPIVADAPIGSIVYYGQPHDGIVEVMVTVEKKQLAISLLRRFI